MTGRGGGEARSAPARHAPRNGVVDVHKYGSELHIRRLYITERSSWGTCMPVAKVWLTSSSLLPFLATLARLNLSKATLTSSSDKGWADPPMACAWVQSGDTTRPSVVILPQILRPNLRCSQPAGSLWSALSFRSSVQYDSFHHDATTICSRLDLLDVLPVRVGSYFSGRGTRQPWSCPIHTKKN